MEPFFEYNTLSLSSPTAYQTFQRSGTSGAIAIAGTWHGRPKDIEARFNGGTWETIDSDVVGAFSGTLNADQGQGTLEVRVVGTSITATAANVGIGDVFIVSGQSNAKAQGTNAQSYSHATLKATKVTQAGAWAEATDPVDTNGPGSGSWMPEFATDALAALGVPVAFIPCARGGTSLSTWQDGQTNYEDMVTRANTFAADFKAVLWWQGENDVTAGTSQNDYYTMLTALADSVWIDLGVPMVVCKLQNFGDNTAVNAAITQAIADHDHIFAGPDLSDLTASDSPHFRTDGEMTTLGNRWAAAALAVLYA